MRAAAQKLNLAGHYVGGQNKQKIYSCADIEVGAGAVFFGSLVHLCVRFVVCIEHTNKVQGT